MRRLAYALIRVNSRTAKTTLLKETAVKHLLAFALTLLLAANGAFAGGTTEGATAELPTVTYLYRGQSSETQIKYREEDLAPALAEDLGIKLKFVDLPSQQYFQKLHLMLAGGEPVDWFWAHTGSMEALVTKDFLLPLNELLDEYGQDILRVVTRRNFNKFSVGDQIMAAASRNMVRPTPNQFLTYRADLREAVGMEKPLASLEDVETYLQKVEAMFPGQARWIVDVNDIMITTRAWDPHATLFQSSGFMSPIYVKQDEKNDKVHNTFESKLFENHCRWMEKLNKQGFIHEDSLSGNIGPAQGFTTGVSVFRRGAGGNRAYEQMPALTANFPNAWIEDEILYPEKPKYISGTAGAAWCIYSQAPEPENTMRMINWLYASQENNDLWTWGMEGRDYTLNNDGTLEMLVDRPMNYSWQTQVSEYFRYPNIMKPEILERVRTSHIGAEMSKAYNWAWQLTSVESEFTAFQSTSVELILPMASGYIPYDEGMPKLRKRLAEARFENILADFQKQFSAFYAENN
jgi:putative aldouronate transport system substrate-binding protein